MASFLLQYDLDAHLTRHPDKIALTDGRISLTYSELSARSQRIADDLKNMGVAAQDRVVVFLPRSIASVMAIFGVLKADATYLPLDHKIPLERLRVILLDALPTAVICDKITKETLSAVLQSSPLPSVALLQLADFSNDTAIGDPLSICDKEVLKHRDRPVYVNQPDDLAYILYTSGSTGVPKGVMISHANVAVYADWACRHFNITESDRILSTAPFHFDMSTFDIYAALKAGATLYIAPEALTLFPQKLVDFIEQHEITLWKGVASLLMYMARTGCLKPGTMPHLKQVLFAGETLPTKYLIDWMTIYPEKSFYNAYGPTEATGVSVCYRINNIPDGPHQHIPIGVPRDDTGILLLDDECREVASGAVGELCISGPGLARGYFNDPIKTGKSFLVTDNGMRIYKTGDLARFTSDGNIEFIGRKDRQLKYMGYRIEAGDIENALLAIPTVRDAAVCLAESSLNDGIRELVAFWEADEGVTAAQVLAELRCRVPAYMIPKKLIPVDRMPRCSRGKIDWNVLNARLTAKA